MLLEGLDPAQREAVTSEAQPLAILAPAGSGKTRVLTSRIAYRIATGAADGDHVLALTFTRRAASELVGRLHGLGVRDRLTVGTFHAVAQATLRNRWRDQGRVPPTLLTDRRSLLTGLAKEGRRGAPAALGPRGLAIVGQEIDWAAARLVRPDDYEVEATKAGRRLRVPVAQVADLYRGYEAAKKARRLMDFDDLLLRCAESIEWDREWCEVQRWRHRHLFVDEAQDLNPLQLRLLDAWRGGRPDLTLVGDPSQAIYGWNGADPRFLRDAAATVPGITTIRLDRSYRSSSEIVDAARAVLRAGGLPAPEVIGRPTPGPRPVVHTTDTATDEIARVVALLDDVRFRHGHWSGTAVLARTNALATRMADELERHGIPTRVRAGGSLADRASVRTWLKRARTDPPPGGLRAMLRDVDDDDELGEAARSYLADEAEPSVDGFTAWLGGATRGGTDAVDVMTFHAAKGLEWRTVVIVGVDDATVPSRGAVAAEPKAEEVRLLHVAVTRAVNELHLIWCRSAPEGPSSAKGRNRTVSLSPLLQPLLDEGLIVDHRAAEPAPPPVPPTVALRPRAGGADDLLAALQAWRRTAASAACVSEPAVLRDDALAAVARARPRSVADVAALAEVGPILARRWGDQLVVIVDAHPWNVPGSRGP